MPGDLEGFLKQGGDPDTVPDDVWNSHGGVALKEKVKGFKSQGGDMGTFSLPKAAPKPAAPEPEMYSDAWIGAHPQQPIPATDPGMVAYREKHRLDNAPKTGDEYRARRSAAGVPIGPAAATPLSADEYRAKRAGIMRRAEDTKDAMEPSTVAGAGADAAARYGGTIVRQGVEGLGQGMTRGSELIGQGSLDRGLMAAAGGAMAPLGAAMGMGAADELSAQRRRDVGPGTHYDPATGRQVPNESTLDMIGRAPGKLMAYGDEVLRASPEAYGLGKSEELQDAFSLGGQLLAAHGAGMAFDAAAPRVTALGKAGLERMSPFRPRPSVPADAMRAPVADVARPGEYEATIANAPQPTPEGFSKMLGPPPEPVRATPFPPRAGPRPNTSRAIVSVGEPALSPREAALLAEKRMGIPRRSAETAPIGTYGAQPVISARSGTPVEGSLIARGPEAAELTATGDGGASQTTTPRLGGDVSAQVAGAKVERVNMPDRADVVRGAAEFKRTDVQPFEATPSGEPFGKTRARRTPVEQEPTEGTTAEPPYEAPESDLSPGETNRLASRRARPFRRGMGRRGGSESGAIDVGAIGDVVKAGVDKADEVLGKSVNVLLKKMGPGGEKLRDALLTSHTRARQVVGEVWTPLADEFAKLPSATKDDVRANLRKYVTGQVPTPQEVRPLVALFRHYVGERLADLQESPSANIMVRDSKVGLRPINRVGQGYFPQSPSAEWRTAIQAEHKPAFNGPRPLSAEWEQLNPGKKAADLFGVKAPSDMDPLHAAFNPANELARENRYPEHAYPKDDWATAESHVLKTAANIAEHETFKFRPAADAPKTTGLLKEYLDEIERTSEDGPAAKKRAMDIALNALGRHPSQQGSGGLMRGLASLEGSYQATTKLGASPINIAQQASQMANAFVMRGFGEPFRGAKKAAGDFKGATSRARTSGQLTPEAFSQSLDMAEGVGGAVQKGARAVSRVATKASELVDRFGRVATSEMTPETIDNLTRDLQSGMTKKRMAAERQLKAYGVAKSEIAAMRNGTYAKGSPQLAQLHNKVGQLINGFINIEGGAINKPEFINRINQAVPGLGDIGWRFKHFHTRQVAIAKYALTEAAHGNWAPAARLGGAAIVLGEGLTGLRNAIYGDKDKSDDWKTILEKRDLGALGKRLANDALLAGLGGMLGPVAMLPTGKTDLERLVLPPAWGTLKRFYEAWQQAKDRKTTRDSGPRFEHGKQTRPRSRLGAFGREGRKVIEGEVPAVKLVEGLVGK